MRTEDRFLQESIERYLVVSDIMMLFSVDFNIVLRSILC